MGFKIIEGVIVNVLTKMEAEERIVEINQTRSKMTARRDELDVKIAAEKDPAKLTALQERRAKVGGRIVKITARKANLQAKIDEL